MGKYHTNDFAALGWAMGAQQLAATPDQQLTSLLDLLDAVHARMEAGHAAGLHGALLGECPNACPALRAAWERGWQRGHAARMRVSIVAVVLD